MVADDEPVGVAAVAGPESSAELCEVRRLLLSEEGPNGSCKNSLEEPARRAERTEIRWNSLSVGQGEARCLWRSERRWEFDWIVVGLIWLSGWCRAARPVLGGVRLLIDEEQITNSELRELTAPDDFPRKKIKDLRPPPVFFFFFDFSLAGKA